MILQRPAWLAPAQIFRRSGARSLRGPVTQGLRPGLVSFASTRLVPIVPVAVAVFAIAMTTGCKQEASDPDGAGASSAPAKSLRIAVMPKLVGIDYFNACERGAREAAKELGVELVYDGPAGNNPEQQTRMLDTWIAKKYEVVAVAPNDPDQIASVLRKAQQRGMGVLTFDADAARDSRAYFINQATYKDIAVTLIDLMAENVGPEAKYIILTGSLTAANQVIWIREMEAYRKAKYPKMQNLSPEPKPTEEDQALATQVMKDVLKSYPDVQGVFAMTSVALPGAAEALREKKAADRVFLTGLSTPKSMRSYVKDGTVKKFALWNPVDLGYLTVHAAKMLVEGALKDGTIQAGRLGEIAVRDGEVLLGKPLIFDAANIDQFDF